MWFSTSLSTVFLALELNEQIEEELFYGPFYNLFNTQKHLIPRQTLRAYRLISMTEWNLVTSAD